MSSTRKVAKNSLWLIIQPLILNLISIVATAYIARVLGKVDYGKFIFAFSFVAMFMPLVNMGLRTITVRKIAKDREHAPEYAGKIIATRLWLALPTVLLIALVVNLVGYDEQTKMIVYLASLNVLVMSISTTIQDVFQAFEHMKYVAYSQFIGGIILTILSVLLLFLGFGLVGLTMAYILGSVITLLAACWYVKGVIGWPSPRFDWNFTWERIVRGAPFFYPSIVALAGMKVGIIILSKMSGPASVGIFGAANTLIEKLLIIPDGICTAMFPAIIVLNKQTSKDAVFLFRRYYEYLLCFALPLAVGTTILAKPIMLLIYGREFIAAVPVLQILIWWLFISFLTSIQAWTLGAIHLEKKGAIVSFITTPLYVVLNLLLIPLYKEQGVAWANLLSAIVSLALLTYFIRTHFASTIISYQRFARIVCAAAIMGAMVYWLRDFHVLISVSAGFVTYFVCSFVFGVINIGQLQEIRSLVFKRAGQYMPGVSCTEEKIQ